MAKDTAKDTVKEMGTDMVNICHATGSESNPWVAIRMSEKAWQAHEKHQGDKDYLYEGPVDAKNRPTNDEWCGVADNGEDHGNGDGAGGGTITGTPSVSASVGAGAAVGGGSLPTVGAELSLILPLALAVLSSVVVRFVKIHA